MRIKFVLIFACISAFCNAQENNTKTLDSLYNIKDYSEYLKEVWKVKTVAEATNDTALILKTRRYLMTIYNFHLNNKDSLQYYYESNVKLAEASNNLEYKTNYQFIWGDHLVSQGQYQEALALFQDLEPVVEANNYRFLPNFYDSYAKLLYFLKDYDAAFAKLKQEAAIFEKRESPENISAVYNNLGILYKYQKQEDSSLHYHQKSLGISERAKDTLAILKSYSNIGQTYDTFGNLVEAVRWYQKAVKLSPDNLTPGLVSKYVNILITTKQYQLAETLLLDVRKNDIDKAQEKSILESLVTLKKNEKKYEEALIYKEQLYELSEQILDATKVKEIERLKATFENEKKELQIQDLQDKTKAQETIIRQNKLLVTITLILIGLLLAIFLLYTLNRNNKNKIIKLQLQQRLLRTQMNPHFIFNALSNIQTNILKQENTKAISYLVKFSKLLRHNLENSNLNTISLANEIIAIKDYLELQKMRLNQSLSYDIVVDNGLEEDIIEIPSMMLQPIIENAIEHGIETVKQPEITIRIADANNHLLCTIQDNGVGFSNTIAKKSDSKSSFSTSIIKQRLQILSKKYKDNFEHTIADVLENGDIIGTIVTLHLPITQDAI